MKRCRLAFMFLFACLFVSLADAYSNESMRIAIDARDITRKLLQAELEIPIASQATEHKVALWYPKWVPGSHGPGGPIANVAGLRIEDNKGNTLVWQRSPGEVYRIEVTVPPDVDRLRVWIRYITNQPTTGSMGHDSWGSPRIGVVTPSTVLLYPEDVDINAQLIAATLKLPSAWKLSSALPSAESQADDSAETVSFKEVSLSQFVDSPIMCGQYRRIFNLTDPKKVKSIPPHRLCLFADTPQKCEIDAEILKRLQAMVTQTALLCGSHPFDQFDILLAVTNNLPPNGLEHSRSTFNVLPPSALSSFAQLRGWNRLLIPHEYLHAWCGKYRRPAGMVTANFHTPMNTELLWVYEGLTQYLGELVEARCGLMSVDQFKHRLLVELQNALHQQGRQWRTLADTGAAAHILRDGSSSWPGLRRSQDFYMEGMLFWLEADAILRTNSNGEKSLDDFCHAFFQATRDTTVPNPYTRDDLIRILDSLVSYDWDGLIRRRVESYQSEFDPSVADSLGYRFQIQEQAPEIPGDTFRLSGAVDAYDSLGATFSTDGVVRNILLDSPADKARLAQGMKIVSIGNFVWSPGRLYQAIRDTKSGSVIELQIVEDEQYRTIAIPYHDGLRAWNLIRNPDLPDQLAEILKPRKFVRASSIAQ